jgi:hypothetical protein
MSKLTVNLLPWEGGGEWGRTSGEGDDTEDIRDECHPVLFEASLSDVFFEISSIRCGNGGGGGDFAMTRVRNAVREMRNVKRCAS